MRVSRAQVDRATGAGRLKRAGMSLAFPGGTFFLLPSYGSRALNLMAAGMRLPAHAGERQFRAGGMGLRAQPPEHGQRSAQLFSRSGRVAGPGKHASPLVVGDCFVQWVRHRAAQLDRRFEHLSRLRQASLPSQRVAQRHERLRLQESETLLVTRFDGLSGERLAAFHIAQINPGERDTLA